MRMDFKPSQLSFDAAGFARDVQAIARRELDAFEEEYLEQMRSVIDDVDTKTYFKNVVKSELKHIEEELTRDVITYVCGFDADSADPGDMMKAYVIAFGMGSKGLTGQPVTAGPPGRPVWDSYLDGPVPGGSTQTEHILPDSWNHPGINFVEEATKMVRVHYQDMLENIIASLPGDIVARHIIVSGG